MQLNNYFTINASAIKAMFWRAVSGRTN